MRIRKIRIWDFRILIFDCEKISALSAPLRSKGVLPLRRRASFAKAWPPKTFPRPSWLPPPAIVDDRLRGGIGPLEPTPAHPIQSLRELMEIRLRGGIRRPRTRRGGPDGSPSPRLRRILRGPTEAEVGVG
jgi:hypothetical protein